jgi:hypothetical protein
MIPKKYLISHVNSESFLKSIYVYGSVIFFSDRLWRILLKYRKVVYWFFQYFTENNVSKVANCNLREIKKLSYDFNKNIKLVFKYLDDLIEKKKV